ncbi:patatin-like phospholipase family protein [Nocardia carnea]|uniref:patatin-like phospholipase family protein n=1 Tax=Nocardia carnea TaxID=37328 RepID=UPI0024547CF7|nr:patatin-like phospholipase family protein [Nocardia carnea]
MAGNRAVVRILVGVAGRSLAVMAGMVAGVADVLDRRLGEDRWQAVALGVSGGAIAAVAAATGMGRDELRQIAVQYPDDLVLGAPHYASMLRRRVLYPRSRVRELARAIAGDRTFADFALPQGGSALLIPVFSARHGNLLLPRDLPELGLTDMPVADALVAATRIPGALPAAVGHPGLFDGGCEYRVPHEIFDPHPSVILDLYGPEPHDSRGGLLFPLLASGLPMIRHRPRPYRNARVRERTIFAGMPYGAALGKPTAPPGDLFDRGYDLAAQWVADRTPEQIRALVCEVPDGPGASRASSAAGTA